MNREEILAKSKQENRGIDYVNMEISKNSMQVGWTVSILLMAAIMVVNAVVKERNSFEIGFAMLAGTSVIFGYKYAKLHKKHELVVTILFALGAIANLVGWILQLVKYGGCP